MAEHNIKHPGRWARGEDIENPYLVGEDGYLLGDLRGGVVYDTFLTPEGIWCWSARVEGDHGHDGEYLAIGAGHYLTEEGARHAAWSEANAWCEDNIPDYEPDYS